VSKTHEQFIITTRYDKQPDGTFTATLVVSGLHDEQMAVRAEAYMHSVFCGREIKPEEFQ
jgi:hypothetical protein